MSENEFKIEKSVPLPPTKPVGNRWARGAKWATLIRSMEIGDSVLLCKPPMPNIYATCRRNGWKLRVKQQPDWRYLRVWRVK